MSLGRECDEQEATNQPNPNRQGGEDLGGLVGWLRIKALDHILIKQRHGGKNHEGQKRVEEIYQLEAVLGSLVWRDCDIAAVDHPQAAGRGEPIADFPLLIPKAIGETEEEARCPT